MRDKAIRKIFTDQTRCFPKNSSHGNQYIMVLIDVNSDAILVELMKNRTSGKMIRAYQTLIDRLRTTGSISKLHVLDNKCSQDFRDTIRCNEMAFQLVSPHDHRRNLAEKAIQTFKDHFIAILRGTDKSFPLTLWDRLLPQAEHTLNLLRPAQMTPTISAYTFLWKQHDYNANPFAPPGCKVRPILSQQFARHGHCTQPAVSTLEMHGTIIAATRYTSSTPSIPAPATPFSTNTNTSPCPPSLPQMYSY